MSSSLLTGRYLPFEYSNPRTTRSHGTSSFVAGLTRISLIGVSDFPSSNRKLTSLLLSTAE